MLLNFRNTKNLPKELIWEMFINEEESGAYDNIEFDDPLKKEFHSSFESIKYDKSSCPDEPDDI